MAIGARTLANEGAVVSRLTAVEELACLDVLCSDKTGTLTKNELSLDRPFLLAPYTEEDIVRVAALASNRCGDTEFSTLTSCWQRR